MADLNSISGPHYADNVDGKSLAALDALSDAVVEADCLAKAWSDSDDASPMAFVVQRMVSRIQEASDRVDFLLRQHVSVERAFHGDAEVSL